MTQFTVNGKTYTAAELEYKDICKIEREFNVSFANMENKSFSAINAFFALSAGISGAEAEKRIQDHVVNGGDFSVITDAFSDAMKESRFFQAAARNREKTQTPQIETEEMKPIDTTAREV